MLATKEYESQECIVMKDVHAAEKTTKLESYVPFQQ